MYNKNKMYEFEKIAIIAVVVMVALIIGLVLFATRDSRKPSTQTPSVGQVESSEGASGDESGVGNIPSAKPDKAIEFVELEVENTKLSEGALILVNQDHEYKTDISSSLVNVYTYNKNEGYSTDWYGLPNVSQTLKKEVLDSFNTMYGDCKDSLQLSGVTMSKTYVSYADQQSEYEQSFDKADAGTKPYLQSGGRSEHQTGLAFNLSASGEAQTMLSWFADNCWKYGFVVRYPTNKESITCVKDEPNHYRYVGIPHATYMKRNELVMEEYLGLLETKTNTLRLKLDVGTNDKYETYTCKADTGATTKIKVPAEGSGWSYMISGTNTGYFVVTIYQLQG